MHIENECISCIINQAAKVADAIEASPSLERELVSHVEGMSHSFSYEQTPPEIAADVYEKMALLAHKEDLYDEVKRASTQKAQSFVPLLQEKITQSHHKLLTATKIAVAGNVIDLAAAVAFDLEEELERVFHTSFATDDFYEMQEELESAQSVLIIGDNVGEHIFDYMFIETLQKLYPEKSYTYFVRGVPIINDVTMKEAKEAGFHKLCNLVDSGVNTPGFTYSRASHKAQELFDNADVIISKGMGNYECMSDTHRENIFFLLKVKCNVVANSLGKTLGDIICKKKGKIDEK